MATERAAWRVLTSAQEEDVLWQLPSEVQNWSQGELIGVDPAITRGEIEEALTEAIEAGQIELYNISDPKGPALSRSDALAAIRDERFWDDHSGADRSFALVLTDEGEVALEEQAARKRRP
jgi:hypothetical protein